MKAFNFKFIGKFDISKIKHKVLNHNLNWDEYQYRQKTFTHHLDTKTIPLIWKEKENKNFEFWTNYKYFETDIIDINKILKNKFGEGEIDTAILINLPSKKEIEKHIDNGLFFKKRNRIHIPIITNENCFFEVGDEIINMKEGEIWEINNDNKLHSVINNGNFDRIHLLIDYSQKKIL